VRTVRTWFLALNVSPRQLADEGFVAGLKATLEAAKLRTAALAIELAEAAVLADPAKAATRLAELATTRCRAGLDDFGAGLCAAPPPHRAAVRRGSTQPVIHRRIAATRHAREPCSRWSRSSPPRRSSRSAVFAEARVDVAAEELRAVGCSAAQGPPSPGAPGGRSHIRAVRHERHLTPLRGANSLASGSVHRPRTRKPRRQGVLRSRFLGRIA